MQCAKAWFGCGWKQDQEFYHWCQIRKANQTNIFIPRSYRETICPAEIGVKSIRETKQNVRVVSEIVFLHQSLASKSVFSDMLVFP